MGGWVDELTEVCPDCEEVVLVVGMEELAERMARSVFRGMARGGAVAIAWAYDGGEEAMVSLMAL